MSTTSGNEQTVSLHDDVILKIEHISKSFPGVLALNDVSINIKKGEILAILGENGAGKSTLMKILSGLYQYDKGKISIDKSWFENDSSTNNLSEIQFSEPLDAIKLGIGQVYQHFQLVGPFSVGENITLGKEYTRNKVKLGPINISLNPLIDEKETNAKIEELSKKFGLPIDPTILVEDLPIGLKQRTEILKQLYREAELLILDEPTAVLTPTEVDELFKTMRSLKESGKSIIFISHKLKESLEIADRIVVLRKGEVVGETTPGTISEKELAEMLVGRRLLSTLERKDLEIGKAILSVSNLHLSLNQNEKNEKNEKNEENEGFHKYILKDINFKIHQNQIVGVVGVQGNGQSELLDCLVGMKKPTSGNIKLNLNEEVDLIDFSTLDILTSSVAYIPEDRNIQGLILDFNLSENSWLAFHGYSALTKINYIETNQNFFQKLLLPLKKMKTIAINIVKNYEVKTPSIFSSMRNLSGGNQQKVLIGREFAKNPDLIIAAEPTRGVDIGVMEKVHLELIQKRDNGSGILLVSSDLDEIFKLSDYILIMYEGQIVGQGKLSDMNLDHISQLMTFGQKISEENP